MFNVVKGRQAQITFLWFTWRSQLSTNTQTNANYLVQYNSDSHVSENSKIKLNITNVEKPHLQG